MYVSKRKGNITIISSSFLIIAIIFFCGIYKTIKYSLYKMEDITIYRSGLEFEEKRETVLKILQEYSNSIEMKEGQVYEYKNRPVEVELYQKYAIMNLKISYKGNVGTIEFLNKAVGAEKIEKTEVFREKLKLCSCEERSCTFNREEVILIPQKEVR
ncbi:MAG: hypothetical protein ACRDDY_07820 [Clostridium sp.]|uniref:hypothetical protein n=1 Tax=Clostridium sp. TaxID=1506 RepID=UPI003EE578B8